MNRLTVLASAALLAAAACRPETETSAGGGGRPESPGERPGTSATTVTEFTTNLQFLPLEGANTRAVSLHFASTARAGAARYSYHAWELLRSGWRGIHESDFEGAAGRAPWRIMPDTALRLTVTADGDPDILILRVGNNEEVLDLGDHLDGWEDRAGTRHEIREASWSRRGQRVSGVVIQHRFALPEPLRPARFGPYERVVLRSEDGAIIVFFDTSDPDTYGNPYAWMYADGLTRRWTALETRTVEVAASAQLRRNVPIRTWFRIPEPDIRCELTAAERLFNEQPAEVGPKPYHALYWVRGWIEFTGERRTVEGLLERGEASAG